MKPDAEAGMQLPIAQREDLAGADVSSGSAPNSRSALAAEQSASEGLRTFAKMHSLKLPRG